MPYTTDDLYRLLPAVHRLRDAERGLPLRGLIAVLAGQAALVEQDIQRLYDNWFIETCDEWAVPYIGDLLGVRGLHDVGDAPFTHRSRVANTLGYRRRKGTASMLEQLARDTTGWPARVVEFYQLVATTQYLNHLRPGSLRTPDLRQDDPLDLLGTPFDSVARTADVRHIDNNRGRYNVPNLGIFLWRLRAFPVSAAPAFRHGDGAYSFSQLGHDAPVFSRAAANFDSSGPILESDVPAPVRRRALASAPAAYYGNGLSLLVTVNGVPKDVVSCNLADWVRRPRTNQVAIDPVLGRLAFAPGEDPAPADVLVTYHYGFGGDVGGGCYERPVAGSARYLIGKSGRAFDGLGPALARWVADGRPEAILEIDDNRVYRESLAVEIPPETSLVIRAANQRRPVIQLTAPWSIAGVAPPPNRPGGQLTIEGLLVTGHRLEVRAGGLGVLRINHCTLVPGWSLRSTGVPAAPDQPSLVVARNPRLQANLTRTISGRVEVLGAESLSVTDSLVDGAGAAAIRSTTLRIDSSTVLGEVAAESIVEANNSIFMGQVAAERRQEGCVRFCYVPAGSTVPRRFRCQPDLAIARAIDEQRRGDPSQSRSIGEIAARLAIELKPRFTGTQYGQPGYGQLHQQCPVEIRAGAEDQSEMGVFHYLRQPQRDTNLRASIEEYLRLGLEAGVFYVT